MFDRPLSFEVRVRLAAWEQSLGDAAKYITLAQRIDEFLAPKATLYSELGATSVAYLTTRSIVSAAIVSACQFTTRGNAGDGVADNYSEQLKDLRRNLCRQSDAENKWHAGKTEEVFRQAREERDRRLAHFDGAAASVEKMEGKGLAISWFGPNPDYIPEKFEDLRLAAIAITRQLMSIESHQFRTYRNEENSQ